MWLSDACAPGARTFRLASLSSSCLRINVFVFANQKGWVFISSAFNRDQTSSKIIWIFRNICLHLSLVKCSKLLICCSFFVVLHNEAGRGNKRGHSFCKIFARYSTSPAFHLCWNKSFPTFFPSAHSRNPLLLWPGLQTLCLSKCLTFLAGDHCVE